MDELQLAASIFLTLIASAIAYLWIFNNSKPPLPPGPRGLPILGYLPFLQENLHHQFTQLAQKYGPIYKLKLGSKLCIVISSPSLVKEIVRDQDVTFANRNPPTAAFVLTSGVDIVWSPYGEYWRNMRKLFVRQMLSNKNLEVSYFLRKEEVCKVVEEVQSKIGKQINVGEMIFKAELNVIFSMLWGGLTGGEKYKKIEANFQNHVLKIVELLGKPNVSDYLVWLAKFDIQGVAKDMRSVKTTVEEVLDTMIDGRLKMMEDEGEGKSKDFLGILLEIMKQDKSLTTTQIKAILLDIIVGGTDTTVTITEWTMSEMLHYPNIMEKVRKELEEVVGMNNMVEESHISKLRYLEAVVKETFRLHPPLPLLVPRSPSQSCVVGGYAIPKHTTIFLNMWSIYKDHEVWENPLEFKPERFLSNNNKFDYMGNDIEFLPFGSGRRVCPGIPLAERMVMHLLATLVHLFDWRLPEGEKIDLSEKFGIVMKKSSPLFAIPSHRLQY